MRSWRNLTTDHSLKVSCFPVLNFFPRQSFQPANNGGSQATDHRHHPPRCQGQRCIKTMMSDFLQDWVFPSIPLATSWHRVMLSHVGRKNKAMWPQGCIESKNKAIIMGAYLKFLASQPERSSEHFAAKQFYRIMCRNRGIFNTAYFYYCNNKSHRRV